MATNGHRSPALSAFDTSVPSAADARTYTIRSFQVSTQKLPILKAAPIEEMTSRLEIAVPEMIFGDNFVSIHHLPTGWGIRFDAFGALNQVDKTGEKRLKVAYSEDWHKSREDVHEFGKMEEVRPFDWSYTPQDHRGEMVQGSESGRAEWEKTEKEIPLELLRRPDPILFFDEVMLYEDELADNGIAMLSVKVRVMPQRLLLLSRFFMRLDGVLLRVKDTRVYVEFETGEVIREYTEKEKAYDEVKNQLAARRDDPTAAMRDANLMAEILPVVRREVESVTLPG